MNNGETIERVKDLIERMLDPHREYEDGAYFRVVGVISAYYWVGLVTMSESDEYIRRAKIPTMGA